MLPSTARTHLRIENLQHCLDAFEVSTKRSAADLDLEPPVSVSHRAPDVVAKAFDVVVRAIVAAAGVDIGNTAAVPFHGFNLGQVAP